MDEEKSNMKKILVIATGGTIASAEEGSGLAPALSGKDLLRAVPQIEEIADIDVVQPMNVDSTNMRPSDWLGIVSVVRSSFAEYDGFVILHGTDTMAYTAAALSYLVQGSPKPIVLTGSQLPMGNPFTDAKLNLYQSVLYAADEGSRDVRIVFGGRVIAGTRARKQRTMSANAFASVNFPEVALIRNNRIVRAAPERVSGSSGNGIGGVAGAMQGAPGATAAPAMPPIVPAPTAAAAAAPRFFDAVNDRVQVLKLTPGMSSQVFSLLRGVCDAIILETFGIGGIPEYGGYQKAIFDWVDAGKALVLTTQVPEEGCDMGVYEVGRAYADHGGILKGGDMTTEALVAKTMWALGCAKDPADVARLFYAPVNHDRTVS